MFLTIYLCTHTKHTQNKNQENRNDKILKDFDIKTDHPSLARRP